YRAAGARSRLHDHGLPQTLGHLGADQAGDVVGVAARCEALDQPDRPVRVRLGGRVGREHAGAETGGKPRQDQLSSSHGYPPPSPYLCGRYDCATMGLRSTPMPSISTSTTSPGFMKRGGLRLQPTPAGVPVTITSPGISVKMVEA